MKGIHYLLWAGVGAMFAGAAALAQINIQPSKECAIPKLDGDKVPFPLKTANSKFELAENETYLLNGYIEHLEGKPSFRIDFQSQPWLATYNRILHPYFPVDADDPKVLGLLPTDLVQMAVVVRDNPKTQPDPAGAELHQPLMLEMIVPPVMIRQMKNVSLQLDGTGGRF